MSYIILAGGCFWGMEDLIVKQQGVISTKVGYIGGHTMDPIYEEVKTGTTGHAEAIKIEFNPNQLSLQKLLHFFFKIHDPTTVNRQGGDIGSQYRSSIFYRSEEQKKCAMKVIQEVENLKKWPKKIVTQLEKETDFYSAEEYHQKYLEKNPGGYSCHFIRN